MITILSALVSLLSFRVRSRASLELEVVALRHQVAVLQRQRSGRLRLFCADRLLCVWLYRVWPRALSPASVRRRPRCANDGAHLPGKHDLRAERRRAQSQCPRAHQAEHLEAGAAVLMHAVMRLAE